jgi:MFS family permease
MSVQFPLSAATLLLLAVGFQRGLLDRRTEGTEMGARRQRRRHVFLPPRPVVVLGAIAFSAFLGEGAAATWSTIYLRDRLGTGAGLAAAGFVAFSLGMAVTRLRSDRYSARLGPVTVVRAGGALAAAGLGLALAAASPGAALVGFALLGVGLAPVVPIAFSASAGLGGGLGSALGWVLTLGYLGSMVGPATIGLTAQVAGLRAALLIPAALAVAIVALAPAVATAPGGRRIAEPRHGAVTHVRKFRL